MNTSGHSFSDGLDVFYKLKMTKKFFILLSLLLTTLTFSCSHKEVHKNLKPLHALLKSKKGADAVKMVDNLAKDSVLAFEPKLFDMGKQAQILVNDVENEKVYLKKSYDTVRFFNSTYGIYDQILKCEKLEQKKLAESGAKLKYHKANRSIIHRYYPNLCAGGRFFYKKKKYGDVTRFMEMVLDVPTYPIWGEDRSITKTEDYVDNAYLYLRSAFFNKEYVNVSRYKDLVMADTAYRQQTLALLTLSALSLKDSTSYLNYLRQGLVEYPKSPFFFTRMTDHFTEKKDYRAALVLADSMLNLDNSNILFLISKSVSLLNLQRNVESIEVSQKILLLDSTLVAPNYYIGAAYCNLANDLKLPININSAAYKQVASKQKSYYAKALPYMECYRKKQPDEKKRWAPLLYRIYLALNMGKQFDEIENILRKL